MMYKKKNAIIVILSVLILNTLLFQNCSPGLLRLQTGSSANSAESVSSFLNETETEINTTKQEFRTQEVYLENSDKVRKIASEDESISEVDAHLPKSKMKIRLVKKSKPKK